MIFINNENRVPVDVDNTLIMHQWNLEHETIVIQCPLLGRNVRVRPNHNNILLLKEKHARGYWVEVWSLSGPHWAMAVVQALGLENYVHAVGPKPKLLIDDKQDEPWKHNVVWIGPDEKYKPAG